MTDEGRNGTTTDTEYADSMAQPWTNVARSTTLARFGRCGAEAAWPQLML